MDTSRFERHGTYEWHIQPTGKMRVPAIIYASEALIRDMDDKVYEQAVNVAALPGIQKASFAMLATSANLCSPGAAWARAPTFSRARRKVRTVRSVLRSTAPAGR